VPCTVNISRISGDVINSFTQRSLARSGPHVQDTTATEIPLIYDKVDSNEAESCLSSRIKTKISGSVQSIRVETTSDVMKRHTEGDRTGRLQSPARVGRQLLKKPLSQDGDVTLKCHYVRKATNDLKNGNQFTNIDDALRRDDSLKVGCILANCSGTLPSGGDPAGTPMRHGREEAEGFESGHQENSSVSSMEITHEVPYLRYL
jgi:hypothetical protein